jgi:DNA-directed RNA polymerase subunit M/transcription elongation factor TFIIS
MEESKDNSVTDTREETDRKCPQCGGVMDFNPASGNLKCPYCEYEEMIAAPEDSPERAQEMDFLEAEHTANKDWGVETKTVLCKACGAQSIYDALQTSGVCPFCGSNQVMEQAVSDTIAPGGVVPFSISDAQAAALFQRWIKKKWFCPKLAKSSAKPKRFQGIYLPYWTFDTRTVSSYQGEYGKEHRHVDAKGNVHTQISWHPTSGIYREFIDDELVLATNSHDTRLLQRLAPFNTENNKSYKPEYIAGFAAERYSIGLKDAWKTALRSINTRLQQHVADQISQEHHVSHTRNIRLQTKYNDITYKYLLLPVWTSHFKYNNQVYTFMINGQTGRVAGNTPISVPKVVLTVISLLVLVLLLYYLAVWR